MSLVFPTLLILLFYPGMLLAIDNEDYNDFKQGINDGENKIDYRNKLLSVDSLHLLIPKKDDSDNILTINGENQGTVSSRLLNETQYLDGERNNHESGKEPNIPTNNQEALDRLKDKGLHRDEIERLKNERLNLKELERLRNLEEFQRLRDLEELERLRRNNIVNGIDERTKKPLSQKDSVMRRFNGQTSRTINNTLIELPATKKVEYGITVGTRIKVKLSSGASNVQPGLIKLEILDDVLGYKKRLPKGTHIFGRPSAVIGSERLYFSAHIGITPDTNSEFSVQAVLYGKDGQPGLIANVITDGRTLSRAIDAGENAFTAGMLSLAPGGIATDAGAAAANQLLREKKGEDQAQQGRPSYVLEAWPQEAVIQIESTF